MTDTFEPLTTLLPGSLVQETSAERSVRNCRVKLLKGAGQEICTSPLLIRFVIDSTGNGQTVVMIKVLLLARLGSRESLPTKAKLVICPVAEGVTVSVTEAELPLLIFPSAPEIGFELVESVPWEVVADFSVTLAGSVLVSRTFNAGTGPAFVTTIV